MVTINYSEDFKRSFPEVVAKDPTPRDNQFKDGELQRLTAIELADLLIDYYSSPGNKKENIDDVLTIAKKSRRDICSALWISPKGTLATSVCRGVEYRYSLDFETTVDPSVTMGNGQAVSAIGENVSTALSFLESTLPPGIPRMLQAENVWKVLIDEKMKIAVVPHGVFSDIPTFRGQAIPQDADASSLFLLDPASGNIKCIVAILNPSLVQKKDDISLLNLIVVLFHEIYGNVYGVLSGTTPTYSRKDREIYAFQRSLDYAIHLNQRLCSNKMKPCPHQVVAIMDSIIEKERRALESWKKQR